MVVGASLDDRDEALTSLATLLLIGGPVALLLASLAGYWRGGSSAAPGRGDAPRAPRRSPPRSGRAATGSAGGRRAPRLGKTLNAMLARLEAAIERERRFVDDASHELRTPLALHKTELELALRYATGEGELRAAIASAVEEVDRLIALAESSAGRRPLRGRTGWRWAASGSTSATCSTVAERFRARAERAGRALPSCDAARLEPVELTGCGSSRR